MGADPRRVSPNMLCEWASRCPERAELSCTVVEQVRSTERFMKRGILLGWLSSADFRRMLRLSEDRPDVVI